MSRMSKIKMFFICSLFVLKFTKSTLTLVYLRIYVMEMKKGNLTLWCVFDSSFRDYPFIMQGIFEEKNPQG
jgi:hypothetical protein